MVLKVICAWKYCNYNAKQQLYQYEKKKPLN